MGYDFAHKHTHTYLSIWIGLCNRRSIKRKMITNANKELVVVAAAAAAAQMLTMCICIFDRKISTKAIEPNRRQNGKTHVVEKRMQSSRQNGKKYTNRTATHLCLCVPCVRASICVSFLFPAFDASLYNLHWNLWILKQF